jgi:hypothetical protein
MYILWLYFCCRTCCNVWHCNLCRACHMHNGSAVGPNCCGVPWNFLTAFRFPHLIPPGPVINQTNDIEQSLHTLYSTSPFYLGPAQSRANWTVQSFIKTHFTQIESTTSHSCCGRSSLTRLVRSFISGLGQIFEARLRNFVELVSRRFSRYHSYGKLYQYRQ